MCLSIPAQVESLLPEKSGRGIVSTGGVKREVVLDCVLELDQQGNIIEDLILNQWVLIHAGMAIAMIDEQQAKETLQALKQMEEI